MRFLIVALLVAISYAQTERDCASPRESCWCDGNVRFGNDTGWTDWKKVDGSIFCDASSFGGFSKLNPTVVVNVTVNGTVNGTRRVPVGTGWSGCKCEPTVPVYEVAWKWLWANDNCDDKTRSAAQQACVRWNTTSENATCSEALTTHPNYEQYKTIPGIECFPLGQGREVDFFGQAKVKTKSPISDVSGVPELSEGVYCEFSSDAGKRNQRFVLVYGLCLIVLVLFFAFAPHSWRKTLDCRCYQKESNRMRMRFLNYDPKVRDGFWGSFWTWYVNNNIYLSLFFTNVNHWNSRIDAAILLFFCNSWAFFCLDFIEGLDLEEPRKTGLEIFLISIFVPQFVAPVLSSFDRRMELRKASKQNACECACCDRLYKVGDWVTEAIIFAVAVGIWFLALLNIETSQNPDCFMNAFVRAQIVWYMISGFFSQLILHIMSWQALINGNQVFYCLLKYTCMLGTHYSEEEEKLELARTPGGTSLGGSNVSQVQEHTAVQMENLPQVPPDSTQL